jgi:flagellar assembly protein FliH
MTTTTPLFMKGAIAVKPEAMKIADVNPAHIRAVSWAPAAAEPAMPQLTVVPPPPPTPPPPSAFMPMPSVTPPAPAPEPQRERARESLRLAIEALRSQGEKLAEQARSDALELGILIARRILEQEITANLDGIFALIKSAIRRAGEEHVTRLRLHPEDVKHLQASAQSEFSLGKIELVADATLERGDVMVDTAQHTIDGRLSTRFDELVRQLDGTASRSHSIAQSPWSCRAAS